MGEKRNPNFIILLKKEGKKTCKIELFNAREFETSNRRNVTSHPHYRLRVNGRWFGEKGKGKNKDVYSWRQVINLVYRSTTPTGKQMPDKKSANKLEGKADEKKQPKNRAV